MCVLVDDAHRLDEPSAEAILFAARRLLADPVAIIVGVRSSEASPFADADLPELALTGLDLGAAEALLAHERDDAVPAGSAERLFRATGGNPLALIELAGEAESVAASLVEGPLPIATTVERAFAGRVSRLSEMARRSLLVASAASNTDLGLLAEAGEGARHRDRGAPGGRGRRSRAPSRMAASSSAIRSSARPCTTRRSPPSAAPSLRARRGDERPALADERAWHLGEAAFGPDDAAAGALADAAARARERGAYAAAALTAERAARLSAAVDVRGRRLLDAASNAWVAGQRRARSRAARRGRAARRATTTSQSTSRACADTSSLARGDAMPAREIFMDGRASRGDRRPPAALLWAEASSPRSAQAAWSPMLDDARAACAALAPDDDGVEACTAQLALGMALVFCGAGDEGPRALRSAIAMAGYAQLLDGPPLVWRWALEAPLFLREARTARESFGARRVRARSRRRGRALARCSSCSRATRPRPIAGPRRAPATTRPPSSREQTGQPSEECAALSGLAWLEAREGREETCRAHAAGRSSRRASYGRGFYEAWALAALGDLELALGRPAEASIA